MERSSTEHVEVIKEVAQHETQQVQKRVPKHELQLVERINEMPLTKTLGHIFEVPRSIAGRVVKQIPKTKVQFAESHVQRFPSCEQHPKQEESMPV